MTVRLVVKKKAGHACEVFQVQESLEGRRLPTRNFDEPAAASRAWFYAAQEGVRTAAALQACNEMVSELSLLTI